MAAGIILFFIPVTIFTQEGLQGKWKFAAPEGEMIMQINVTTIVINGQSFTYSQGDNSLQIYDGYSYTAYPFRLNGNQLTLVFPYGQEITFTRDVSAPASESRLPVSMQNPAGTNKPSATASLTGKWLFQSTEGQLVLEFISADQLVFNGETTQYQLKEGIIQAMGDYGWIDYPYTFSQGKLMITFPDGTRLPFSKTSSAPANQAIQGQSAGSGQVWQLKGPLCLWSGSSNDYSSYSRTESITFDGSGNFTYGKESSFSGDAGIAYSGNADASRGTYIVEEKYVTLRFNSGESYKMEVNMRQNNGRITELMYNGQLYASGLCDQ